MKPLLLKGDTLGVGRLNSYEFGWNETLWKIGTRPLQKNNMLEDCKQL